MTEIHKDFLHFSSAFNYQLYEDYSSSEEFVAMSSRWGSGGTAIDQAGLRKFLTQLIEGPYSDEELEALWDSSRHDFPLTGAELRQYLPIMRDNVGLPPPRSQAQV